ncbi:hypothetical protein LBMAG34_3640 [Candidatus Saccharibacteria bacterium]|nr:hypothetical protein LBMAG34_3640 [Candidatus Saccharibacteria bacterium]
MNLQDLIGRYPSEQIDELKRLIREFINCELQIYIGDTHLRSWEEEDSRLRAQKIALVLRGPPWGMSIEDLEYLCDNAQEILNELNRS